MVRCTASRCSFVCRLKTRLIYDAAPILYRIMRCLRVYEDVSRITLLALIRNTSPMRLRNVSRLMYRGEDNNHPCIESSICIRLHSNRNSFGCILIRSALSRLFFKQLIANKRAITFLSDRSVRSFVSWSRVIRRRRENRIIRFT